MRLAPFGFALCALTAILTPAGSLGEEGTPLPEQRVSVEARGEPLRYAVRSLTSGTGTEVIVDPLVPDVPVRIALREVTIDHALRLIVRQVGREHPQVQYEVTENGFRIYFAAPVAPPAEAEDNPNRVTVTVRSQLPAQARRTGQTQIGAYQPRRYFPSRGGFGPARLLSRGGFASGGTLIVPSKNGKGSKVFVFSRSGVWWNAAAPVTSPVPPPTSGVGPGTPPGTGGLGRRPL